MQITLNFTDQAFAELKSEFNIRASLGDLNVSMSMADRILVVIATDNHENGTILSTKEIREQ